MRTIAAVLALLACGHAGAQSLYKCIDRQGATSYQSAPCDAAARTVWQREAPPEPPPDAEQLRARAAQRDRDRDRAESDHLSRRAGTSGPSRARSTATRSPARDGCAAAKARRERTLAAAGLKRTFDLLRRLDDAVYEACK